MSENEVTFQNILLHAKPPKARAELRKPETETAQAAPPKKRRYRQRDIATCPHGKRRWGRKPCPKCNSRYLSEARYRRRAEHALSNPAIPHPEDERAG